MSTVIIILHYHNEYLEAFGNITETKERNSISDCLITTDYRVLQT